MKPLLVDRPCAREEPPLVGPGTTLSELLADLATRMTPEQRGAFRLKMATMDLERGDLSAATVTLGRA